MNEREKEYTPISPEDIVLKPGSHGYLVRSVVVHDNALRRLSDREAQIRADMLAGLIKRSRDRISEQGGEYLDVKEIPSVRRDSRFLGERDDTVNNIFILAHKD